MSQATADKSASGTVLEALQGLMPAEAFSPEELEELLPFCSWLHLERDAVLIRQGDPADNLVYILFTGSVSVHINDRFILQLSNRGDTVGEMGLISAAPRSATVRADGECTLLALDASAHANAGDSRDYKFRYYFSRLFNTILTEKLRRTSHRAQLYEDLAEHSQSVELEREDMRREIALYLDQINLFSHLVNSAKDAIIITDTAGRVLNANPALAVAFGVDTTAVVGVEIGILFGLPDGSPGNWEVMVRTADGPGWNGEVVIFHPRKGQIPADCSVSAVRGDGKEVLAYSVILRDIRERKALEDQARDQSRQLEDAYRRFQELDLAKRNFLNLISHELRTPLTTIQAYTELMTTEGMVDSVEEQQEFIGIIHTETQKLTHMVKKVLAIAKLESGEMMFNFSEHDLDDLVRTTVAMLRPSAEIKGLVLNFSAQPDMKPLLCDEESLKEAVQQLVENAIRFSETGKIEVRVESDNGQALIRVRDEGMGIVGKDFHQLLEMFGRGDPNNVGVHGLGLGLPLCYLIVTAHQGALDLQSNESGGLVSGTLASGTLESGTLESGANTGAGTTATITMPRLTSAPPQSD